MTIAISVKVNDGIVLAADSATSIIQRFVNGTSGVVNVYNNANKVFNLYKGLPIGVITWGAGSIGVSSIGTLIKDYRKILTDIEESKINHDTYTIRDIANGFKDFVFDKYTDAFHDWPPDSKPSVGFMVVGYSAGSDMAEEYMISIANGICGDPVLTRDINDTGLTWNGEPEAITRLVFGISNALPQIIKDGNYMDISMLDKFMNDVRQKQQIPFVIPAMPIQDAIDFAEFMVHTTINFTKFNNGAPTVGGPIEIAAITKHEGFKWVKRKHYFNKDLNC